MSVVSRRLARGAAYALLSLVVLLAIVITFTVGWRPLIGPRKRALTGRKFEATPARLQRGQYLVEHVSLCYGCHTPFDVKGKEMPVFLAPKGSGRVMLQQGDFRVVAPNITSDRSGIGAWSDDELARAIREGIGRDGRALFPMMPYGNFRRISDEDLASMIVYLRSQPAAKSALGRTSLPFPVSRLINSAPRPVNAPVLAPDPKDTVAYGNYLVNAVGDCNGCHSPRDNHGEPLPHMEFGGGNPFDESGVRVVSANITPDATGISYYDEATFVLAMRTGHVRGRKLNVMMPWRAFQGLTDADLRAMYAYLRTIPPVRHRIDNTEPPTLCRIDGQMHGLGNTN
jgi:mono/diheme cytochrome c family protein